ncbi:MAG: hypothetical protein AB7H97_07500, partial [Pseudobdellovibrionaceae bacterium]
IAVLMLGVSLNSYAETDSEVLRPTDLRVTSFNIKWYGLGGSLEGNPSKEKRDGTIRDFISNYVPESDVMIFEEVVDKNRLIKNILPAGTRCVSYQHQDSKHQYVLVCVSDKYTFMDEPSDNNDVIDDVAINSRSRPAVHAIVAKNGRPVLRVVGVHLKAMPNESKSRLFQIEKIGEYLQNVSDTRIPVVITGDFNTYDVGNTGLNENDDVLFDRIFTRLSLNISQVPNPHSYTYWSPRYQSKFDRFWASGNAPIQGQVVASGMCNKSKPQGPFNDANYYSRNVSDHCPVTVTMKLK